MYNMPNALGVRGADYHVAKPGGPLEDGRELTSGPDFLTADFGGHTKGHRQP